MSNVCAQTSAVAHRYEYSGRLLKPYRCKCMGTSQSSHVVASKVRSGNCSNVLGHPNLIFC